MADRSSQKLAFKFFGPYKVVDKIGQVAYRLELLASSAVHPIFHVSQLKKVVGARHEVTPSPPPASILWSIPERILQRRQVPQGARLVHQGLIQWSNLPVTLATWEDLEHLRQQFPRASLWNDPDAQGEGGVTAPTGIPDPKTSTAGRLTTEDPDSPTEEKHLRPRARNPCVYSPDWVNP